MRSASTGIFAPTLLALTFFAASPASAQLRPLDPVDWDVLGSETHTIVVGAGLYGGQRASLAGTEGRLFELGTFRANWSLGRVSLELSGTAQRVFEEQSSFAQPLAGVRPVEGSFRHDNGDYRVTTVVQLTHPGSQVGAAVRFGVRLPTTDDRQGLERDQSDFYSTVVGRTVHGPFEVVGEMGLGINGTRDLQVGQVDPMLFALSGKWRFDGWALVAEATGQHDTRRGADRRGTEDLGEARFGVRMGRARWVRVTAVRGWTPYSPDLGMTVAFGTRF